MKSVPVYRKDINFTPYLMENEKVLALGAFRKVPSVSAMMLTRGLARYFSSRSFAAVTTDRIILLPVSGKTGQIGDEPITSFGFNDVKFYETFLFATVMEVRLPGEELYLRLRFSGQMLTLGLDKFEFIAAVYQGKSR